MRSGSMTASKRLSLVNAVMISERSRVRSQIFGVAAGVESPLVVPGWLGPATMKPAAASCVAIHAMPSTRDPEPWDSSTSGKRPCLMEPFLKTGDPSKMRLSPAIMSSPPPVDGYQTVTASERSRCG